MAFSSFNEFLSMVSIDSEAYVWVSETALSHRHPNLADKAAKWWHLLFVLFGKKFRYTIGFFSTLVHFWRFIHYIVRQYQRHVYRSTSCVTSNDAFYACRSSSYVSFASYTRCFVCKKFRSFGSSMAMTRFIPKTSTKICWSIKDVECLCYLSNASNTIF